MSAFQEYARAFEHLRNLSAWTSLPNSDVAVQILLEGLERSLILLDDCERSEPPAQKPVCQRIRAQTQVLMIELQKAARITTPAQQQVIVQRSKNWIEAVERDLRIWKTNEAG